MLDSRNFGSITGGLVADPDVRDKIVRLRLAADYAGSDRANPDNKTGYFNVVLFASSAGYDFVKRMASEGKLKKGSQIQVLYTLRQSRWQNNEGENRSDIELVAENVNYLPTNRSNPDSGETQRQTSEKQQAQAIPAEF